MEAAAARSVLSSLTPAAALIFFGQEYVHMREASFIEEIFFEREVYFRQNRRYDPPSSFRGSSWPLNFQKDQFNPSTFIFRSNSSLY